jgi:hypothetical protein
MIALDPAIDFARSGAKESHGSLRWWAALRSVMTNVGTNWRSSKNMSSRKLRILRKQSQTENPTDTSSNPQQLQPPEFRFLSW